MATGATRTFITPEQYEAIEERSEIRHEYYRGEMFAMVGGSVNHGLTAGNIAREIGNQFEGRACTVLQREMRVRVQATGLYTYPDVVAVCGPASFDSDKKTTLLNPTAVFEVLSPSTEVYDRSTKLDHYKAIESLQEIVLVAHDRVRIDKLTRVAGQWVWTSLLKLDGVMILDSIGCKIPISRIYARVDVPEENLRQVGPADDD